jgi:hypothetical protein
MTGWRTRLDEQLRLLGRWTHGRFVAELGPGEEWVEARRYLDPEFLAATIDRSKVTTLLARPDTTATDTVDLRAAASRITRLVSGFLTYVAGAALARGVGLDLSLANCKVVIRYNVPFAVALDAPDDRVVRCAERETTWTEDGRIVETLAELREIVWRSLYGGAIAPLFATTAQLVKAAPSLHWSNAAEAAGILSDAAEEYLGEAEARPFVADRHALLEADTLPGIVGPNPMRGLLTWIPGDLPEVPSGVMTRRVCCLSFYMPDRLGRLCQDCEFLPLDERIALVRERHGLLQTAPRGPAEEQAKRRGMEKLSARASRHAGR